MYSMKYRIGNQWHDHFLGWCGTGMSEHSMKGKSEFDFKVSYAHIVSSFPRKNVNAIKLGVSILDFEKDAYQMVWSDPAEL